MTLRTSYALQRLTRSAQRNVNAQIAAACKAAGITSRWHRDIVKKNAIREQPPTRSQWQTIDSWPSEARALTEEKHYQAHHRTETTRVMKVVWDEEERSAAPLPPADPAVQQAEQEVEAAEQEVETANLNKADREAFKTLDFDRLIKHHASDASARGRGLRYAVLKLVELCKENPDREIEYPQNLTMEMRLVKQVVDLYCDLVDGRPRSSPAAVVKLITNQKAKDDAD